MLDYINNLYGYRKICIYINYFGIKKPCINCYCYGSPCVSCKKYIESEYHCISDFNVIGYNVISYKNILPYLCKYTNIDYKSYETFCKSSKYENICNIDIRKIDLVYY